MSSDSKLPLSTRSVLASDIGNPELAMRCSRKSEFNYANKTSDWALEALHWATENGIINGRGNGIWR